MTRVDGGADLRGSVPSQIRLGGVNEMLFYMELVVLWRTSVMSFC